MRSEGRIIGAASAAAQRKIFNARDSHPAHACVLLAMFRKLYGIEDRAKQFSTEDRQAHRSAEARPIGERMREYLASEAVTNVLPKESFGQALAYLRNQFGHLLVYLDDGLIPIDNNETEKWVKQAALGRMNWMFIGSVDVGYRAADLMSLVSGATRYELDVSHYAKDILARLLATEIKRESLRPDVWKQSQPEAIQLYRVDERRSRADAKACTRARWRLAKRR